MFQRKGPSLRSFRRWISRTAVYRCTAEQKKTGDFTPDPGQPVHRRWVESIIFLNCSSVSLTLVTFHLSTMNFARAFSALIGHSQKMAVQSEVASAQPRPAVSPADDPPRDAAESPQTTGKVISSGGRFGRSQPNNGCELLALPELMSFLDENHFGLGRHNGAVLKSRDALMLGKSELVSRFQNILERIVQSKEHQLGRLQDMREATQGIETSMTARLEGACSFVEREIATCIEQSRLAAQQTGWVAEVLNRYEMGYRQGLAQALDFEELLRGR